jgi:hypothetical protein
LALTGFATCLAHVTDYEKERDLSLIFSLVMSVLLFFVLFFVCGLLTFHVYLIATGLTTNEKIKQTWPSRRFNPYAWRTLAENCGIKYSARKSKPQFDAKAVISQYSEDFSPNLALRNVKVMKIYRTFGTAEETLDNKGKLQSVGNIPQSNRSQSPFVSEDS